MVNKTVFVTGGTGMVGKYVVEELLKRKYKVKILTRKDNLGGDYVVGEITDKKIEKYLKNCFGVIHLAACMGVKDSYKEFYRVNVVGIKNILKLSKKAKVKKFVNVSSVIALKPNEGDYAKTKASALEVAKMYKNDMDISNVYPTIVIDPYKIVEPDGSVLQKILWKIAGGIPGGLMGLFGSSRRLVNYVLVENLAKGIVDVLEKGGKGEDYILGGENITIKDYLKKMAKFYKRWYLPIRIPFLKINDFKFSSAKAEKELGYKIKKIDG